MSDLRDKIAAIRAAATTSSQTVAPSPVHSTNTLPHVAEVTVANAFLFENGDTWRKWTVSFQLYTNTQPFSPSTDNTAFDGLAVLRTPDVFCNVMEQYRADHPGAISNEIWSRYVQESTRASNLPSGNHADFPRVGQLARSGCGTNYEFGSFSTAFYTAHQGFALDLTLPTGTIRFREFLEVTKVPGKPSPVLRCRLDPHGIVVAKTRMRRAKP